MRLNAALCAAAFLGLATTATARPWDCTVWQWDQSAKLSLGTFTVDPAKLETQRLAIDANTTAACAGEMGRTATTALLECSIYLEAEHYNSRGIVSDDSSYLLVSGNHTDTLIDNQIECAPAGAAKGKADR